MNTITQKYVTLCVLMLSIFLMVLPVGGHEFDTYCWRQWSKEIFANGIGGIYNGTTDYLPLYLYILKLYGLLAGSIEEIDKNIHYLKIISLLFHFLLGYFLIRWVKKNNDSDSDLLFKSLFYVLNFAILYNSIVWNQVDIILSSLVFLSCYFGYKKRVILSLMFFVAAINFKLHAIIFIPVIGLILLPNIIKFCSLKNMLNWVLTPLILQLIILFPFLISGTLKDLMNVVTNSVGKYPFVSMNAYNVWDFLLPGDLMQISDKQTFIGVSYKNWGLIMFFSTSGLALLPLMKQTYIAIKSNKLLNLKQADFLLICTIIPLLFFYFNTQMHERYSHIAITFLIAYALYTNKLWYLFIGSFAYFANLESVLKFMHFNNYENVIFDRDLISFIFFLLIVFLYIDLFRIKALFKLNLGSYFKHS